MIHSLAEKNEILIFESVATNATATANVDSNGFDYLDIDVHLDTQASTASNPATLSLSESDDTVATNFFAISTGDGTDTNDFTIPDADTQDPQTIRTRPVNPILWAVVA